MNKLILTAFVALVALQTINGQLFILQVAINVVVSLWSFCSYTVNTTSWSMREITTGVVTTDVISIQTSTLTSMVVINTKLALQASTCSSGLSSMNTTIAQMQSQSSSSSSSMTTVNSMLSQLTITTASQSQTNLYYLLLVITTSSAGKTVTGSPSVDSSIPPPPTSVSTVGQQAQAFIKYSGNMQQEIMIQCQKLDDLKASSSANCTMCPTLEQCAMIADQWNNVSLTITTYSNSTLSGTTLIKFCNTTVQGNLIAVMNATNVLIASMKECAKCLNAGFCKNQAVLARPCSKRKGKDGMTSKEAKSYCKQKASNSAKRNSRNVSGCRKNKAKKSNKQKSANRKKAKGHFKGAFEKAKGMCSNFVSNASSTAITNTFVRGLMGRYGSSLTIYTFTAVNQSEVVNQNITDNAIAAKNVTDETIKNATKAFNTEIYNFTMKVFEDNVESCQSFVNDASTLQFEFLFEVSKCSDILTNVTQQSLVNVSTTYTLWIQQVNIWSNCHDRCVAGYCPNLLFGLNTAIGVCWVMKRLFPRMYDKPEHIQAYQNCHTECSAQIQIATLSISSDAQAIMEQNTKSTQQAVKMVQECIASTFTAYEQKLKDIQAAYDACVAAQTTTSTASTSTSTTDSTTSTSSGSTTSTSSGSTTSTSSGSTTSTSSGSTTSTSSPSTTSTSSGSTTSTSSDSTTSTSSPSTTSTSSPSTTSTSSPSTTSTSTDTTTSTTGSTTSTTDSTTSTTSPTTSTTSPTTSTSTDSTTTSTTASTTTVAPKNCVQQAALAQLLAMLGVMNGGVDLLAFINMSGCGCATGSPQPVPGYPAGYYTCA